MNLTKEDFHNLLVFLKRTPAEGLDEAMVLATLGVKLKAILKEIQNGENSTPAS